MVAIIDYKAGNLTSVKLAFAALGVNAVVTSDEKIIRSASHVVFPGVGAAKSAMENLRALNLVNVVQDVAISGKPFLGICLGMQILFEHSEEDGGVDLLGVLPGKVKRFSSDGFKVPEIGWNQVKFLDEEREIDYYFVHSFYAEKGDFTFGITNYAGVDFTSAVKKDNLVAYQFHPEKSGRAGLDLLKKFIES